MRNSVVLYFPKVSSEADLRRRFEEFLNDIRFGSDSIIPSSIMISEVYESITFDSEMSTLYQVFNSVSNDIMD